MPPFDSGSDDLTVRDPNERAWAPVTPVFLTVLLTFFAIYLYGLARNMASSDIINTTFMQIHAVGHALFRVFGLTAAVAGGTMLQLLVPLALGLFFIHRRQPKGVALCLFFFFEQFLPIARYMADAQAQQLPLISIGSYESAIHDWNYLFSKLGLLPYDIVIANIFRSVGCVGMISVTFWFLWRGVMDIARGR
jgi:hypothetical protein